MTILDRAIGTLAPHVALRRARQRAAIALLTAHAVPIGHARSYEGARLGRRTDGWIVAGASANAEVGGALVRLRDRSRDLVRNNPYAAKAAGALCRNPIPASPRRHSSYSSPLKCQSPSLLSKES
jgi:capsid protein